MKGSYSNVYGHLDGLVMRAQAKQLQSTLTSEISMTENLMSLEASKLIEMV